MKLPTWRMVLHALVLLIVLPVSTGSQCGSGWITCWDCVREECWTRRLGVNYRSLLCLKCLLESAGKELMCWVGAVLTHLALE